MDRLAFKSTTNKTLEQMHEATEKLGGNIQCASAREAIMYQSATFNNAIPNTLALVAETIRNPAITEEEVAAQIEIARYEIDEIWAKPDLIIPELLHMTAYKDNTLGNPLLCPKDRLDVINRQTIETYRNRFYRPERMVVAFVGTKHDEAVKLVEQYFGDMKSPPSQEQPSAPTFIPPESQPQSPKSSTIGSRILSKIPFSNFSTSATSNATVSSNPSLLNYSPDPLTYPSHYTGGYLALPPIPVPKNTLTIPLSYVQIAFECPPISSPDIFALATLQTLLGGGGSFSAGGPGKGMYSRLYTNVLNQHGWVESCVAFNHSYSDSGIFGIAATCEPGRVSGMIDVMCRQFQSLTLSSGYSRLQDIEVNRAKNQLKFGLLMNLESRLVELEDLGRQVQIHGKKIGVKEMCDEIDKLTVKDLVRVANQVFSGSIENPGKGTGRPTVVIQEGEDVLGRTTGIRWEEVQDRISKWGLGKP
jgi:mitochondrial-processing peptidase subunit alpha